MANRQWGYTGQIEQRTYITLPISATPLEVVANDMNIDGNPLILATANYELGKFMIGGRRISGDIDKYVWAYWVAICK